MYSPFLSGKHDANLPPNRSSFAFDLACSQTDSRDIGGGGADWCFVRYTGTIHIFSKFYTWNDWRIFARLIVQTFEPQLQIKMGDKCQSNEKFHKKSQCFVRSIKGSQTELLDFSLSSLRKVEKAAVDNETWKGWMKGIFRRFFEIEQNFAGPRQGFKCFSSSKARRYFSSNFSQKKKPLELFVRSLQRVW